MIDVRTLTCGLFLLRYLVVDRDVILQPEIQLWEVGKAQHRQIFHFRTRTHQTRSKAPDTVRSFSHLSL